MRHTIQRSPNSLVRRVYAASTLHSSVPLLVGVGLLCFLAGAVVLLPPLPVVVAFVAVLVGAGILVRPAEAVIASVGLRMIVDMLWWVNVGPLNAMQVYSGAAVATTTLLVLLAIREVGESRVFVPAALFFALVVIALARQPNLDGFSGSLKLVGPWLLMLLGPILLTSLERIRALLLTMMVSAVVPITLSVWYGLTGQRFEQVAHSWRLVGGYLSVTDHACAMFFFCTLAAYWWFHSRGWWRLLVCLSGAGAFLGLFLSYTRAGYVGLVVALGLYLWFTGRRSYVVVVVGSLIVVALQSVVFAERFLILFDNLVGGGGFEDTSRAMGSGRFWLWRTTLGDFARGGPTTVLLGRGIGGHVNHAFGHDPHQEFLAIMYQLGPLGVVAWVWALGLTAASGLQAWSAANPILADTARFLVALCMGCLVISMITNGFFTRASLSWYFGASLGALLAIGRLAAQAERGLVHLVKSDHVNAADPRQVG